MKEVWNDCNLKQTGIVAGTALAVYLVFRWILPLVAPFFVAYLLAKMVEPVIVYVRKKWHIGGGVSGSIVMSLFISGIGIGVFYLIKILLEQLESVVQGFPVYSQMLIEKGEFLCNCVDRFCGIQQGNTAVYMQRVMEGAGVQMQEKIVPFLSTYTVNGMKFLFSAGGLLFIILIAAFMIIKDMDDLRIMYQESWLCEKGNSILKKLSVIGVAYAKAELIIAVVTTFICTIGFLMTGSGYAVLWGIGIGILDMLPVFGSGLILIPWVVIKIFQGKLYHAAVLGTVFVLCQIAREFLEAKLIGEKLGMKAIFSIMSMYIGIKLFGIPGVFLGPAAFVIVKTAAEMTYDR